VAARSAEPRSRKARAHRAGARNGCWRAIPAIRGNSYYNPREGREGLRPAAGGRKTLLPTVGGAAIPEPAISCTCQATFNYRLRPLLDALADKQDPAAASMRPISTRPCTRWVVYRIGYYPTTLGFRFCGRALQAKNAGDADVNLQPPTSWRHHPRRCRPPASAIGAYGQGPRPTSRIAQFSVPRHNPGIGGETGRSMPR